MAAGDAAEAAGARLISGGGRVDHASVLAGAEAGAVCFAESEAALAGAGAPALVLTTRALAAAAAEACPNAALAVTKRPKLAFARLASRLHRSLTEGAWPEGTAMVAPGASVHPSAVLGAGAVVGEACVVGPYAIVGPGTVLGPGCRLGPHASVGHAVLGQACVLSAGVRVGEAGFGYAPGEAGAVAVPQLGRVILGDHVDLGANTTVDRGALGDTVIGEGTKIDNLCHVAHNCRLGRHVLVAGQTGLSGSVVIGDGARIGGQVGMADHLTIGEGAVITARSGLMKNVPAGERWGGFPARPARRWMKETATLARLAREGEKR